MRHNNARLWSRIKHAITRRHGHRSWMPVWCNECQRWYGYGQ